MAEAKGMVAGFNHNVKHGGKLYHVQTEDSGLGNPRITTHLFVGGNVIASKTTTYAEILGAESLASVVRLIMEEQHKEMLRNVVSGVYDEVEAARPPGSPAAVPPPLLQRGAAAPPLAAPDAAPRPAAPVALGAQALLRGRLAGEKSLDEVILAYLVDDPGKRK
jgi:hypothetical protein